MRNSDMMVAPVRAAMTRMGLEELRTPGDVDAFMANVQDGTGLLVVNSMCGCAAGSMRPAVELALGRGVRPDRVATVFAGQDLEATARAREFLAPHPPSSPAVALFRDGALVFILHRSDIQGRDPHVLADALAQAIERHAAA